MYRLKPSKYLSSVGLDIDYVDLSLLIWKVRHYACSYVPIKNSIAHNSEGRKARFSRPDQNACICD